MQGLQMLLEDEGDETQPHGCKNLTLLCAIAIILPETCAPSFVKSRTLRPLQTHFVLFQQKSFVLVCIHPGNPRVSPHFCPRSVLAQRPKPCGGKNVIPTGQWHHRAMANSLYETCLQGVIVFQCNHQGKNPVKDDEYN